MADDEKKPTVEEAQARVRQVLEDLIKDPSDRIRMSKAIAGFLAAHVRLERAKATANYQRGVNQGAADEARRQSLVPIFERIFGPNDPMLMGKKGRA